MKTIHASFLAGLTLLLAMGSAQAVEIAIDGGFEANVIQNGDDANPDVPGWVAFNLFNGSIATTTVNPYAGTYAGQLFTTAAPGNTVLKNANIGIGTVQPNSDITVSFWARGTGADIFVELFSEIDGGGVSKSELLANIGGGLDPDTWNFFTFDRVTGGDVSGGVTVQFAAVTGAVPGSTSELFVDNLSVQVVPVPAAVWLFGSALGLLGWVRRKAA